MRLPIAGALRRGSSGRALRVWTAASASVLIAALGIILLTGGTSIIGLLELAGVMLLIEATLRRNLVSVLVAVTIIGIGAVGVGALISLGNLATWQPGDGGRPAPTAHGGIPRNTGRARGSPGPARRSA